MEYNEGPSLEALYELLRFAEAGNLAEAAELLQLSPPTLSRKLKPFKSSRLMGGEPILVKQGKTLRLTERGRALLPAVRELCRQYSQLTAYMAAEAGTPEVVRLGVGRFATEFYCPPAFADLHESARRFTIDTRVVRGRERIVGTAEGRFDLAIVSHDRRDVDDQLRSRGLGTGALIVEALVRHPFCLLAPRRSPIGKVLQKTDAARAVSWDLLGGQTLVGLDEESGLRRQLESLLGRQDAAVRFASGTGAGGWPAAKAYARHGLGPAVVPSATIRAEDRREFVIRTLDDRLAVVDYLIHRNKPLTDAQNAVKQAIVRAAAGLATRLGTSRSDGKRGRR